MSQSLINMIQNIILKPLFLEVPTSTFTVVKHKPLNVIQKFQKVGAKEDAPNIFRGSLCLPGAPIKKKKNMAAMTKSVNRTI